MSGWSSCTITIIKVGSPFYETLDFKTDSGDMTDSIDIHQSALILFQNEVKADAVTIRNH